MKHIYIAFIAIATLLACGCGGNKNEGKPGPQSDSAQTLDQESPVAGPTDFYLTADSIGPVHVGEKIANIPQAVANFYDVILPTETPDAMAYTYLLSDIPQFTIYDFMDGKADVIALEGNARSVKTPDGEIRVGDEFMKVLRLPGVESEYQSIDDMGIWYWKWNGLYFGVDETNISEKFADELCEGRHAPKAADFTSDVKIGYIATGLPF